MAVLSAASRQNNFGSQILAFGAAGNEETPCIPVPDSTGIIDNYEELYKPNRWQDPATYIRSSQGIDEYCDNALANQLTYYLDERDAEWLDRNNKFARGEGTSVQGALLEGRMIPSLYLSRGLKATERDTDPVQPLEISQDEFELVMGIYEKTTQEQAACLPNVCHGYGPAQKLIFSPVCRVSRLLHCPSSQTITRPLLGHYSLLYFPRLRFPYGFHRPKNLFILLE